MTGAPVTGRGNPPRTGLLRAGLPRVRIASPQRGPGPPVPAAARVTTIAAAAVLLVIFPLVFNSPFWLETGILAMIFATAATGWNVLGGYAGQVSFGNAVFLGAGAYTTAIAVRAGWSPWLGICAGAVAATVIALLIGLPCFRLRSHYFAIATIAVGEIADIIVNGNSRLGASAGLTIPLHQQGLATLQFSVRNPAPYYYVALLVFAAGALCTWLLLRGRTGLYLQAIRDDEDAAAAAGVNVWRYKVLAAVASAVLTAVPGGIYAMYVLFVDPSLVLDLTVSINLVLMVMLGGIGSMWGPLIGAWVLELLQQYTRQQFGAVAGLDLMIFGICIVIIMLVEPGGITALTSRGWAATPFARTASRGPAGSTSGGSRQ